MISRKMMISIFRSLIPLAVLLPLCSGAILAEDKKLKPICSWDEAASVKRTNVQNACRPDQFQCIRSLTCIQREFYCNNNWYDCDDESDERYCSGSYSCPTSPRFHKCQNSRRCIPPDWICNGYTDCPSGDDERNCGMLPFGITKNVPQRMRNVLEWLHNQRVQNSPDKWGTNVDKLALILYLISPDFNTSTQNEVIDEIANELKIQLLSRLTKTKLEDVPSVDLASYLNAFLVTCIDPRNFQGYDIIQNLRNRVNQENYTNPYVLLTLCNAGETITESDKKKLVDTFWNVHRAFWTDMQAVVVMALACASKQPVNEVDSDTLHEMTMELKQRQYRNGTVINLSTTALVMQALIATDSEKDPDNFDELKALAELQRNQQPDGSFGDLMNTFLVAPILACRSLADIDSDHCHYGTRDESSALENLSRRSGPKIRVHYSLWIGKERDLERNLMLRVPQNMSLYGIMETAAEIDSRFKFEYSVKDRKPYINAISGMRDNPLTGKFWFLYNVQNGQSQLSNASPADIIPTDNSHYVMWYRRGTWVDSTSEIKKER